MKKEFKGKTILVTGGTGSIGSALVKEVLKFSPRNVRIFSRDDTKQHELIEDLGYPENVSLLIGDIRDKERLAFAFRGVDIVLHAAALKHVHISEYNPFEVVKTNVVGSQNVIGAAIEQRVRKVIAISTDKAVNPTGILGVSKLMMEKLFLGSNNYVRKEETKFSCARFGNVIWSRGSVLHAWKNQAARDKTIRVTNHSMTRFFMSKPQAARLVLRSAALASGGEVFIFNMPSISLTGLAKMFVEKYHAGDEVKIEVVGNRGGEKIYEELFDFSDLQKEIHSDGEIFIILPQGSGNSSYRGFRKIKIEKLPTSQDTIDIEKIREII